MVFSANGSLFQVHAWKQLLDSYKGHVELLFQFAIDARAEIEVACKKHVRLTVWLISLLQINPRRLIHNAGIMGKCIETGHAVILSHTALTYTAEAHSAGDDMDQRFIDTAAAK